MVYWDLKIRPKAILTSLSWVQAHFNLNEPNLSLVHYACHEAELSLSWAGQGLDQLTLLTPLTSYMEKTICGFEQYRS